MYTAVIPRRIAVVMTDRAAPWPIRKDTKAVLYAKIPSVLVAESGPPAETSQIWLKTLKSQITDMIVTSSRVGRRNGSVTDHHTRHSPAPSSRAASGSSTGSWVSAAYRVSAMNGTACHTTSSQIDRYASEAFCPQSVLVMSPNTCAWVSSQLTTP